MRILTIFVGFLALSGCSQYRAERQAEQNQADGAKCESFGAARGSVPYIQCMVEMDNQRAANRRAAVAGVQQSIQGFQPVMPGYQVQPIPNQLASQPVQRNTTCNTIGTTTNCTTN